MGADRIRLFLNQHCRFVLRSGKEVFGVIWEIKSSDDTKYYFSSISDHKTYQQTRSLEDLQSMMDVDINDVLLAERLVG